jgi:hypothetical protein
LIIFACETPDAERRETKTIWIDIDVIEVINTIQAKTVGEHIGREVQRIEGKGGKT